MVGQAIDIGCTIRAGSDIMEFPATPQLFQPGDHRQHRGDADAARDHHRVAGIFHHWEIILRVSNVEDLAHAPLFMDVARSAPAVDRMVHRNLIIATNGRVVDQRIAAGEAG